MPLAWLTADSLFRAWEHVRDNAGCAGADGVTIERFARDLDAELSRLLHDLERGQYCCLPLLPITVKEGQKHLYARAMKDNVKRFIRINIFTSQVQDITKREY